MPEKPPRTLTADGLGDILDQVIDELPGENGNGAGAGADDNDGESDETTRTEGTEDQTQPATPTPAPTPTQPTQVVEVRRFGPPDRVPTTDEILGRPPAQPPPPTPDSFRPADGRATRDPLAEDRERPEKKGKSGKDAADVALRNLLKEYPSTRLVNVRIFWRNRSGEYRYKGSRKNVDVNEIRRPDNIVAPYGKDWIVSFQPIEARWDDPKSWQSFQFDRDGPEPAEDWTIDAPPKDGLFLEVDGMGPIGMNDLKELIMAGSKAGALEMLKQVGLVNPQGQIQVPGFPGSYPGSYPGFPTGGQPYGAPPPPYMQPPPPPPTPPPPPPVPVRDAVAEEREREMRETIKRLETGLQNITQRAADTERAAAERIQKAESDSRERVYAAEKDRLEAQHKAEVEALKSTFQSAMDQNRAALDASRTSMEALNTKLAAIEIKANLPPPSPPPPPPPQTDISTALIQIVPHVKDIFTASRSADAETARIREQAQAAERLREADERVREREREREERERERERRRADEDRGREEMRERREAFERENMRMREEAQRTLDLYRTMGQQAADNARMISELFSKQQDPSGTVTVIKMATESMTQQMQLWAAMAKNGLLGGSGAGQPAFDWGRLAEQSLNMLGNVGSAWAESRARSVATAARAAQAIIPPSNLPMAGLPPQQVVVRPVAAQPTVVPQQPGQPPLQGQPQQDEVEINPLTPFVHGVNQSIIKKEPPDKVADKIAGIVHIAQSFGELEKNRTLKALMENPEVFLKRAYPDADPAYLHAIAQQLIEMFPPEGEEGGGEEEEENAQQNAPQEASSPAPQPQQPRATPSSPAPQPQQPSPTPVPQPPRPQVVLVDDSPGNGGPQVAPSPDTAAPATAQPQVRRGPGRPRRTLPTIVAVNPLSPEPPEPPETPPEPPTETSTTGASAG